MMKRFLSCDWGTSSFRLRMIDAEMNILAEVATRQGMTTTYDEWTKTGRGEHERMSYYQSYLAEQIREIENQKRISLQNIPLVISGMASSTIGMKEIAYKPLPVEISETGFSFERIDPSPKFSHMMIIISGIRTGDDVLRGEETMLAGVAEKTNGEEQVYIFPGTHSKHISVRNGQAINFKTYMTGEFFDLLSNKSILSKSVTRNALEKLTRNSHFEQGVREGAASNLLNVAFHARTNQLLGKLSPADNYHFLSGLLIGSELKDLQGTSHRIFLVCNEGIKAQYLQAMEQLGLSANAKYIDADTALVKGQYAIAFHLL